MKAERLSMSLVILGLFAAMVATDRSLSAPNILMGLAVLIGFVPAWNRSAARSNAPTDRLSWIKAVPRLWGETVDSNTTASVLGYIVGIIGIAVAVLVLVNHTALSDVEDIINRVLTTVYAKHVPNREVPVSRVIEHK